MKIENNQIDSENLPEHIAIIMDGNGRWAKKQKKPRLFGHNAGMKTLHNTVYAASHIGIKVLTVYAFSTENWKRSQEEVSGLMTLAVEYFVKEISELHKNNVKVRIIGDKTGLPQKVQEAAQKAEDKTAKNTGLILNVALNYGGRADIVQAVQKIVKKGFKPEDITEDLISAYLYTAGLPDPDIMLRTGGDLRLSNFMIWQNAYSEFFFDDIWWPDFNEAALLKVIEAYQQRERRFGEVKEK